MEEKIRELIEAYARECDRLMKREQEIDDAVKRLMTEKTLNAAKYHAKRELITSLSRMLEEEGKDNDTMANTTG